MSTQTSAMPELATLGVDQLSGYRSTLEAQWRHQVATIAELSYEALDATSDRDDDGSYAADQLLSSSLLAAARQQLQDTEAALARLDDGSFGRCASCGQRISAERLEILPAARLCVGCQSRRATR